MESQWDFYQCMVDGNPASIYLDLGWAAAAPVPHLPNMAYVRVHMRQPRTDGLSSQEEYQSLIALEDQLLAQLEKADSIVFVGRNTSGGCRDFYFYSAQADRWQELVESAMRAQPGYRFDCGTREDPEWSSYFRFLFPSERQRQSIENRRVCVALENQGDDLKADRDIDHWAYFPDTISRDRFAASVLALGFQVRELLPMAEGDGFGVVVSRADAPVNVDKPVLMLFDSAVETGGRYDGWETYVVQRP